MTIGERLKAAREARRVSLDEACRVTKIQRKTIEAIEEDRVEEILDTAYARIFLKKYAYYLGIDGSALLQEYPFQPAQASDSALSVQTAAPRLPKEDLVPSALVPIATGLVALIGVGFLAYLSVDLLRNLSVSSKERALVRPAVVAEHRQPERPLLVPRSKPLKLTVQTTADVWLQVKADGAVIYQNVLAKGSQEDWTAKQDLELWTGNAGAMKLSLNGKPLDGLGRGVRKGIRVTHAGITE
jgi:transcriptional regulator with XRE-family HTH domain